MTEHVETDTEATVLLVDDNPQNLKVLYETLKDRGYRLLIANDGEAALVLAKRHLPEVILLDIMMPEMDGYEVCRQLKSDPDTADAAIVFLSALDDVDSKVRGFSLGGADYIAKPFQAQEVIARVRTHARVIRLERQLYSRNRQLKNDQSRILNAISEGIYGLDAEGRIIFANPAAALITQISPDEIIGRNFFELHFNQAPGEALPKPASGIPVEATCRQGVAEHQRNIIMCRPDGSTFPAEYRATPKLDGEVLYGAVVVFRDISAELHSEAALEEARAMVQEQREQLAAASRMSTMGEMAAGFAHEVNQPLTAISNYARVALRMLTAEPLDRDLLTSTLAKVEAQSHRASEIIRRIRGFVKKPASSHEVVAVPALLDDVRQLAEVDIRNNAGGIEMDVMDGLPRVQGDPIQIQQVALNLIRNGLEATGSAGCLAPVVISAERQGDGFVRISITDKGGGLSEEAEDKLFLPFYSTKDEGMGIGLSLCRSLIQSQGGDIGFERPEAGGARFWFTLPVAAGD